MTVDGSVDGGCRWRCRRWLSMEVATAAMVRISVRIGEVNGEVVLTVTWHGGAQRRSKDQRHGKVECDGAE